MRHLSKTELMMLLEDPRALPEPRSTHAVACARCRGEAESLRAVVSALRADQAPEPSPLFWDHFSARVRAQVEVSPVEAAGARARSFVVRWLPAGAVMLALAALVAWGIGNIPGRGAPAPSSESRDALQRAAVEPAAEPATSTTEEDQPWALVQVLADDLDWDHLVNAGIVVEPGTVDLVTHTLTEAELRELVRLIKADLAYPGS